MAQYVGYRTIRDNFYTMLKANPKLDPTNDEAYVRAIYDRKWIPGGPLPCVCVYIAGKPEDQHITIGYNPHVDVLVTIDIVETIPAKNMTTAMKTLLGETKLDSVKDVNDEVLEITDEVESWIRGDETDAGKRRRRLNCSPDEVKIVLLGPTNFGDMIQQGAQSYIFGTINAVVKRRLLNT